MAPWFIGSVWSQQLPPAAAHSFLLVWPGGAEGAPKARLYRAPHLIHCIRKELSHVSGEMWEWDDIFRHWWDLVLSAYLLHPDSRLAPKAEETNLNFLQLAYSWAPCVSRTCLIMWLPDVFSTSCTASRDPTPTHFPSNEWKSPLLVSDLSLHHWKQTDRRRCWNNSLCVKSVWRLASVWLSWVGIAPTLKLNVKGWGEDTAGKAGTPLNQSWGLWDIFCLASVCFLATGWTLAMHPGSYHQGLDCSAVSDLSQGKCPLLDNSGKILASWKN